VRVIGTVIVRLTAAIVIPGATFRALEESCTNDEIIRSLQLPDLVTRAKVMGVVVVQNPTHFDPGVSHFVERFGKNHPYLPLRSLVAGGIPLAFGSDGPMNPGLNILFARIHPARPGEGMSARPGWT
jgi:hypothetical protein